MSTHTHRGVAPFVPKNPSGPLRVIIIGRVSTEHQAESNIQAAYEYARNYLRDVYDGDVDVREFGERASGMLVERETIMEASREIASGRWDVVLMEDISRSYRNPAYMMFFVQAAVDAETRVIAPGDGLDTADESWEIALQTAVLRHGLYIPDVRRRVRRTAAYAFRRGGMVQKVRFGYRKLSQEEADSGEFGPRGLRIAKMPEHTPTIREIARRVIAGEFYESIADWLKAEGIRPGPYVEGDWTGRLVADNLRDPILRGLRTFGDVRYTMIFATGKHKRKKNPDGPETGYYPELAHLSDDVHRRVLREMDRRVEDNGNSLSGPNHPRHNVPRSRAYFPAQHARCGVCGGLMYRYDNDQLKCRHSFRPSTNRCWNHVQVRCDQVRSKVIPWMIAELGCQPAFQATMISTAWGEYERRQRQQHRADDSLAQQIVELEHETGNLAKAIRLGGELEQLVVELRQAEKELGRLRERRAKQLERGREATRFRSGDDIRRNLDSAIQDLAASSFDFANVLRQLMPRLDIIPVQAFDTGQVRPRARLTLAFEDGNQSQTVQADIDLFDPPLPFRHLEECRRMKSENPGLSLKQIANRLGLNHMTVKRALDADRQLQRLGLAEPYLELTEMPERASRWKM